MITFQDTSLLKIESDVSFFLQTQDKPTIDFIEPNSEKCYFRHLIRIYQQEAFHRPVEEAITTSFFYFIRYLLRSNLSFDHSFFLPISQKLSKLSFMNGDYYLAKAGACFLPFKENKLLSDAMVMTLQTISKSQWLQSRQLFSRFEWFQLVMLRYGSLFQFCMKAPGYLSNKKTEWPKKKMIYANTTALYCTLLANKYLSGYITHAKRNTFDLIRLQKKITIVRREKWD